MDSSVYAYPVYLGVWTNWSYGRILGSTLTLTMSNGALLIAFTALFVTIIATQLWRTFCFVLYNFYSTSNSQDALYNQRQAMLRNSSSPIAGTWYLMKLIWAWNEQAANYRPWRRLLPLMLTTILIAAAQIVASGLSSRIVRGDEVLIDGSNCGVINVTDFDRAFRLRYNVAYQGRMLEQAADYAQRCYESQSNSNDCNSFPRAALPFTTTSNAGCPFDESLCLSQDSNIILDTGFLDSHTDMGLNWPVDSRFQVQYKYHCAPLVTEGYSRAFTFKDTNYMSYRYGASSLPDSGCNCTFAVNTDGEEEDRKAHNSPFLEKTPQYSILTSTAQYSNGSLIEDHSTFPPIFGLNPTNGDLDLIALLPSGVHFFGESEDIWYRASTPSNLTTALTETSGGITTTELYIADEPAWPMGCVQQFQMCKASICTGLGSFVDTTNKLHELGVRSDFFDLANYLDRNTMGSVTYQLGEKALASRYQTASGMQASPRRNDWHRDVAHWFTTMLARQQINLAEIARGPSVGDLQALEPYIIKPNASESQQFCHSQKIRSTAYTSFSMFWLLLVYLAGSFIIAISASLETLTHYARRWFNPKSSGYTELEWRANHPLHLQRLAHEEHGTTQWKRGRWDIPVTDAEAELAVFDIFGQTGLPRLVRYRGGVQSEEKTTPHNVIETGSMGHLHLEKSAATTQANDASLSPVSTITTEVGESETESRHDMINSMPLSEQHAITAHEK